MTRDDVLKLQTYKLFENSEELYVSRDDVLKALQTEPCADAINRQEAIDAINEYGSVWMEYTETMSVDEIADRALKASKQSMHKILHDLPSVKPAQKVGRWKRVSIDKYVQHAMAYYRCSECSCEIIGTHKYCPACGCRMLEEGE